MPAESAHGLVCMVSRHAQASLGAWHPPSSHPLGDGQKRVGSRFGLPSTLRFCLRKSHPPVPQNDSRPCSTLTLSALSLWVSTLPAMVCSQIPIVSLVRVDSPAISTRSTNQRLSDLLWSKAINVQGLHFAARHLGGSMRIGAVIVVQHNFDGPAYVACGNG